MNLNSDFKKAFSREVKRMDMGKIDDWLSGIPSKYTRKTYKAGIRKFEEFYEKALNL